MNQISVSTSILDPNKHFLAPPGCPLMAANVILSILLTNFYNQAATVGCVVVFIFHPDHGYFKQRDRASKVEDHYVNLVSHPIMTFCQLFYFQKSHLNILQWSLI